MASQKRNTEGRFVATHGKTDTSEFNIWLGMKQRCYDKNHKFYSHYGQRGIKVCDRWLNSFENFYKDMGNKPIGYSLDRIDNDGDYEPSNCKWSTPKEQANNVRTNRRITIGSITKNLSQWMDESTVKRSTVKQRYYVYKWSAAESLGLTRRRG